MSTMEEREGLQLVPEAGRGLLREEAYHALKALLVMSHRPPEPFLSERKLAKQLGRQE